MTYVRGDVAQFDAWEDLGNTGWNWDSLFPYYIKSEKSTVPTSGQLSDGATYQSRYHGFDGHVHTGYNPDLNASSFASNVIKTFEALSLPHNPDLNSGSVHGFSMGPQTLDPTLDMRWDSARAYYYPVESRKNLQILKGTVERILWAPKKSKSLVVANGVEYVDDNGKRHRLSAKKEVIVSAGSLRTPLVLEASGIGNPRFGIKIHLSLSS